MPEAWRIGVSPSAREEKSTRHGYDRGVFLNALFQITLAAAPPESIFIPAGSFVLGEEGVTDAPPTPVELSAFRIDPVEVTIGRFEAFVADASGKGWAGDGCWSSEGRAWRDAHPEGRGALARAAGRGVTHPVVAVTYWEAEAYCTCAGGSLPTEAQWERAACGREPRVPSPTEADNIRVYDGGKHADLTGVRTRSVAEASAYRNTWGLVDMFGNAWEWTRDAYQARGYTTLAGLDPVATGESPWRAVRGGSYMNLASYSECSHREPVRPDEPRLSTGFRCVYTP